MAFIFVLFLCSESVLSGQVAWADGGEVCALAMAPFCGDATTGAFFCPPFYVHGQSRRPCGKTRPKGIRETRTATHAHPAKE